MSMAYIFDAVDTTCCGINAEVAIIWLIDLPSWSVVIVLCLDDYRTPNGLLAAALRS